MITAGARVLKGVFAAWQVGRGNRSKTNLGTGTETGERANLHAKFAGACHAGAMDRRGEFHYGGHVLRQAGALDDVIAGDVKRRHEQQAAFEIALQRRSVHACTVQGVGLPGGVNQRIWTALRHQLPFKPRECGVVQRHSGFD